MSVSSRARGKLPFMWRNLPARADQTHLVCAISDRFTIPNYHPKLIDHVRRRGRPFVRIYAAAGWLVYNLDETTADSASHRA